jgi:hypothetical protein
LELNFYFDLTTTTRPRLGGIAPNAARGAALKPSQIGAANTQTGTVDEQHLTSPGATLGTFQGETSALIFDAILHSDPPPAIRFNRDIPSKLEDIIGKALEKDQPPLSERSRHAD